MPDLGVARLFRAGGVPLLRCRGTGSFCASAIAVDQAGHVEALAAHHRQLQVWAENCPDNFANRAALVGAEIARLGGRELDAERLYEQAIRSARANGFVHNEALASEIAARFYAARGLQINAQAHLRNARRCYLNWGADGKVRQLDQLHPHLREADSAPALTGTIGASVEQLDLATVIKVSQAISGEIELEKLIDALMHTAIEQAGAERGLLIFASGAEQRVVAEATTRGDTVVVDLLDEPVVAETKLPELILQLCLTHQRERHSERCREPVRICSRSVHPSAPSPLSPLFAIAQSGQAHRCPVS